MFTTFGRSFCIYAQSWTRDYRNKIYLSLIYTNKLTKFEFCTNDDYVFKVGFYDELSGFISQRQQALEVRVQDFENAEPIKAKITQQRYIRRASFETLIR